MKNENTSKIVNTEKSSTQNTENFNRHIIISERSHTGLNIYLVEPSGQRHYLMSHRENRLLFNTLREGMSLGEIRRMKPNRKGSTQVIMHSVKYIVLVAERFLQFDLQTYPSVA